ncbi:MAG: hypothetical protein Q9157_000282 [Trypethelium eluteriae]
MASPRSPPFRAEHIGSLLRPDELVKHRYAVADQSATPESLVPIEQKAIRDVVALQQSCGIHSITNGEYSRHQFWGTFFETLNGMEEVNLREGGYLPEFEFMKTLVPKDQWKNIKITLASPSWYHFRYGPNRAYVKGVYANDDEYFADVAKAYQAELSILYEAGLRNAQVDDPNLAYFCSDAMLSGWKADPLNFQTADKQFAAYMKFYNACFERPADLHLGIHLCRGNYLNSQHFSEGAYDNIASIMFNTLNVSTFYLEYDTPRAGGFEPLKFLPRNKNVVLGVVTSKFPTLEDKKEMVERVYKAADFVAEGESTGTREEALKRLSVSPQCGFASHAEGNALGYEDMRKKLTLVRNIADEVWPGEP